MSGLARILAAITLWAAAAALGWWWQQPEAMPAAAPPSPAASEGLPSLPGRSTDDARARRVAAADPMGLGRMAAAAQQRTEGTAPGAALAEAVTWRVAALVVRGGERYAVLTATDQPPIRVAEGDRLPDGDRVKSIGSGRMQLQSPRGRLRTIYLTEP